MKQRKLNVTEFEGCGVTVTIKGGVEEYAKKFLAIFNNVRESRELLSVENSYDNDVTVYCEPESKDELVKWLEQFGEVKSVEKMLMYQIDDLPDYDLDKYWGQVVVPYSE